MFLKQVHQKAKGKALSLVKINLPTLIKREYGTINNQRYSTFMRQRYGTLDISPDIMIDGKNQIFEKSQTYEFIWDICNVLGKEDYIKSNAYKTIDFILPKPFTLSSVKENQGNFNIYDESYNHGLEKLSQGMNSSIPNLRGLISFGMNLDKFIEEAKQRNIQEISQLIRKDSFIIQTTASQMDNLMDEFWELLKEEEKDRQDEYQLKKIVMIYREESEDEEIKLIASQLSLIYKLLSRLGIGLSIHLNASKRLSKNLGKMTSKFAYYKVGANILKFRDVTLKNFMSVLVSDLDGEVKGEIVQQITEQDEEYLHIIKEEEGLIVKPEHIQSFDGSINCISPEFTKRLPEKIINFTITAKPDSFFTSSLSSLESLNPKISINLKIRRNLFKFSGKETPNTFNLIFPHLQKLNLRSLDIEEPINSFDYIKELVLSKRSLKELKIEVISGESDFIVTDEDLDFMKKLTSVEVKMDTLDPSYCINSILSLVRENLDKDIKISLPKSTYLSRYRKLQILSKG